MNAREFTCDSCGFQSAPSSEVACGYMEVLVHAGVVHTLCSLCATSLRIGRCVNDTQGHGAILHLPELTQGQLINLIRICDVAAIEKLSYQDNASALSRKFMRHAATKDVYPFFTSPGDIQQLSNAFRLRSPRIAPHFGVLFKDLRYLPFRTDFRHIYQYYYKVNPKHFENPYLGTS